MNLIDTYRHAEKNGINIRYYPLGALAISTPDGFIGIDPEYETIEALIHEIGHILTGAFYSRGSDEVSVHKAENTATNYAIKVLVPRKELDRLVQEYGFVNPWQVAERFGTSVEFAEKAIKFYKSY